MRLLKLTLALAGLGLAVAGEALHSSANRVRRDGLPDRGRRAPLHPASERVVPRSSGPQSAGPARRLGHGRGRDELYGRARALLAQHYGYDDFRPQQRAVIRAALAGRDVLAVLPTGAGKSVCFQVPALALGGLTLVISPLIALMQDQVAGLKRRGIAAAALHGAVSDSDRDAVWNSLAARPSGCSTSRPRVRPVSSRGCASRDRTGPDRRR